MRSRHSRAAAITLALTAGGLAAFALRPAAGTSTATLAARNPAVELRTQVIRRTIHVIRHEPGAEFRGARGRSSLLGPVHGHDHARTGASGTHRATGAHRAGAGAVATRASGSHGGRMGLTTGSAAPVSTRASGPHGSSPVPDTHPVSTRASGSQGSSPAPPSHPVSTRTSGSHGGPSGGSSSGSSGRPVSTRSSGGAHHGGDGSEGHERGDD